MSRDRTATLLSATPHDQEGHETYGLSGVLTVEEAARFLRCDKKTIYTAIKDGLMPGRKLGRRVVILRDALLRWLASQERVPPPRRP